MELKDASESAQQLSQSLAESSRWQEQCSRRLVHSRVNSRPKSC